MATPRCRLYDRLKPVTAHCTSRCVRRTPLLGPEERRCALRDRLAELVRIFAIDVLEWSLMPNHFHLVAATHPDLASLWSDREVARRWRTLSPDYAWRRANGVARHLPAQPQEIEEALLNPELVARWRIDLADLSAFHKFLKQRLARVINLQDDVTGHCFEGRFKSIVALDEEAVIAHMVYVALNPVRACLSESLDDYEFGSIAGRVAELKARIAAGDFAGEAERARRKLRSVALRPALPCDPGDEARKARRLRDGRRNPWFGGRTPSLLGGDSGIGLASFVAHVEAAGRTPRPGKRGTIAPWAPSPLEALSAVIGTPLLRLRRTPPSSPAGPGDEADPGPDRDSIRDPDPLTLMVEQLEQSMERGLASPIGNFSGRVESVANAARERGRRCLVAVAGFLAGAGRRIAAARE